MDYISEGCERITGRSPQEFLEGMVHFSHITFQQDQDQVWKNKQEALGENQPFNLDYRIRDKKGNTKYIRELGRDIFDAYGNLQTLEGFMTDITLQKEAEFALEYEKETLHQYLDTEASIFLVIIRNHTIELVNKKGCEILGQGQDEIIGKNWSIALYQEGIEKS